ncbi:MAG: phosphatase PAP2 family protein [Lachnospiraceae bacterium]
MYVTLRFFSFPKYFVTFESAQGQKAKGHKQMKKSGKKLLSVGMIMMVVFAIWTALIQRVDVQPVGQNGTNIGFASLNCWFHKLTGVHMAIYTVTDWLGLVPLFICMLFGGIGFVQLVKRRNLFKVDFDIIILGIYYVLVILGYMIFEMIPINYRPILIKGIMEASYPSSTTLLVLSVMPTLNFQVKRRMKNTMIKNAINSFSVLFSLFMVIGRTISGVHWLTDIIGSVILSIGLYLIYKSSVLLYDKNVKA